VFVQTTQQISFLCSCNFAAYPEWFIP